MDAIFPHPPADVSGTLAGGAAPEDRLGAAFRTITGAIDQCCRLDDYDEAAALLERIVELGNRAAGRVRLIGEARAASTERSNG